jgi:hypothetical protein
MPANTKITTAMTTFLEKSTNPSLGDDTEKTVKRVSNLFNIEPDAATALAYFFEAMREEDESGEDDVTEEPDDEPVVKKKKKVVEEDEEDDEPVVKKKKKVVEDEDEEPDPEDGEEPEPEDPEDDEPVVKKKKKVVEEDEEDEPVVKKKKKVVEEDEEDEPVSKKKKKAVEEDEEDGEGVDNDTSTDYDEMSVNALKKEAKERGYDVKDVTKKAKNEAGIKKALVSALEQYDELESKLMGYSLKKLEKIAAAQDLEWEKPRGRAGDDKKVAAIVAALMANGYEEDE